MSLSLSLRFALGSLMHKLRARQALDTLSAVGFLETDKYLPTIGKS